MRRTTVSLLEEQVDLVDKLVKDTSQKDRSAVIRDLLTKGLQQTSNPGIYSGGSRISRLTESARFINNITDPVAYSYAGPMHYLEQEKMVSLATQLYSQNPLAHRLISVIVEFCVGDPMTWETSDKKLHQLLEKFWKHPRNALHKKQYLKASELLLYGEQCYPAFVHPETALVQFGGIHPAFIKQTILDPDDCNLVIGVEVYTTVTATRTYRVILSGDPEEYLNDRALEMRREMSGDCFYYAINTPSLPMTANGFGDRQYQSRGRSELLPLMDRLGMLDDLNYLNLDRAQILMGLIYEITVQQGTPRDIEKLALDFGLPRGPVVRAHDEKTKIDIKTPQLGAMEIEKLFKMLQDEILGGIGLPSQWFGDSGNANRATAMSMELPTLKMLSSKQTIIADMFRGMLDYQVEQGKLHRVIPDDAEYTLNVPAITKKDLLVIGDALNKAVANLVKAVDQGWITNEKAGEVFRELAQYGVELTKPEESVLQIHDEAVLDIQQPHDYIGKDNPEEELDEKQDRDLLNEVSSNGRYVE